MFLARTKRSLAEYELKKSRFGGSKVLIPLDKEKIVVECWKDIVIRFNGDPYRGRSRSVPNQNWYKTAKCWTLENVSFLSPDPPPRHGSAGPPAGKLFLALATVPGAANVLAPVKQRCGTDFRSAGGKTVSHISNCARCGKCPRPSKTKMRHGFSVRRRKNCFSPPSFGAE